MRESPYSMDLQIVTLHGVKHPKSTCASPVCQALITRLHALSQQRLDAEAWQTCWYTPPLFRQPGLLVNMRGPVYKPPSGVCLAPLIVIHPRDNRTWRRLSGTLVDDEHHGSCQG